MNQPQPPLPFKWNKFFVLLLLPPALSFVGISIWPPLGLIGSLSIGTGIYCGLMLYRGIMALSFLKLQWYFRIAIAFICCLILTLLSLMLNYAGCMGGKTMHEKVMHEPVFGRVSHKADITTAYQSINKDNGSHAKENKEKAP